MLLIHRLGRAVLLAGILTASAACSGSDPDQSDAGTTEVCDKPCGKECCGPNKACDTKAQRCLSTCTPSCLNRECGSDLCGGSCGDCPAGKGCVDGECSDCTPNCLGKQCGDDGCGQQCGVCMGNRPCVRGVCGECVPNCAGIECGADGCGGSCGHCPPPSTCGGDGRIGRCGL